MSIGVKRAVDSSSKESLCDSVMITLRSVYAKLLKYHRGHARGTTMLKYKKYRRKMSLTRLKAGTKWFSQKVLFHTVLFGKEYYWMEDVDGTIHLVRCDEQGNPVL